MKNANIAALLGPRGGPAMRRLAGILLLVEALFFLTIAFTGSPGPLGVVVGTGAGGLGILMGRRWGPPLAYVTSISLAVLYAWVSIAVQASPIAIALVVENALIFVLMVLSRNVTPSAPTMPRKGGV